MNTAVGNNSSNDMAGENTESLEKTRRIEDCISSVISHVNSITNREITSQTSTALFSSNRLDTNSMGALNSQYLTSVIPKHKSLASALPSLTGIMVNPGLSNLSTSNATTRNVSSTTTSAASSRHLQLVGDLPENVLETSCTPPASPSKVVSGQQNSSSLPVLTALTPIGMVNDNLHGNTTTTVTMGIMSPIIQDTNHATRINLSQSPITAMNSNLGQLYSTTHAMSNTMPQTFLAVKVEPQDIDSANPNSDISINASSSILSPLQLSLAPGGLFTSPPLSTSVGAAAGTSVAAIATGSLSGITSSSDLLSLQPAAIYVQPIQQNGQLQYVRVDLPANVQFGQTSSGGSKQSTVELAHSIIATMFQQPLGTQANDVQVLDSAELLTVDVQPNEMAVTSVTIPSTFVLTDQTDVTSETTMATFGVSMDSHATSASGRIHPRSVPGLTVTATMNPMELNVQQQGAASVASRKRVSSSASQARDHQQSLSKDGLSSAGNTGSASGEDDFDDIYIDTKDLCNRIAYELKTHSIPQAIFAERVLCRSQGTLSDLLRNPKPWNKLKSGRETFRRMYVWLKQPLEERLATLELWKGGKRKSSTTDEALEEGETMNMVKLTESSGAESPVSEEISSEDVCYRPEILTSPQPDEPIASTSDRQPSISMTEQTSPQRHQQRGIKKPRLVFTDIQKRTLQAIFKETQRPSREMQQTIAEHLNLDLSTVQNFFMNARRRSRIEQADVDADTPTPFQQVRPITPPPAGNLSSSNATSMGSTPTREKPKRTAMEHHEQSVFEMQGIPMDDGRSATFSGILAHDIDHGTSGQRSVNGEEIDENLLVHDDLEEELIEEEDEELGDESPDVSYMNALHYGDPNPQLVTMDDDHNSNNEHVAMAASSTAKSRRI